MFVGAILVGSLGYSVLYICFFEGCADVKSTMMRMLGQLISMSASSLRQLARDMETVINVLQPGPLGIVEHKYSNKEIAEARAAAHKAVENWRQASLNRVRTDKE